MSDFERTKMDVLGRNVMVTSWLDPESQTWKASAPGVTHDSKRSGADGYSTREDAISNLSVELEQHFRASALRQEQKGP